MNKAIVLYDNITSTDTEYKQRIQDITEFFLSAPQDYKVVNTNTLTATLNDLQNQGYEWVFVNSLGHSVDIPTIYDRLIELSTEQNNPLMGHIIFRPGSYPTIDAQFFLLNLKKWASVGSPSFERVGSSVYFTSCNLSRSTENAHDDYTPFWVRAAEGTTEYEVYEKLFGIEVVQKFLETGYTINNFSQEVRNNKWNLYPNYNYDMLKPFFQDGTMLYPPDKTPNIIKRILNEQASLSDTVYILNSEQVYTYGPEFGPLDNYIGVAAGFKGVLLLKLMGFTEQTTVSLIDVSTAGLNYQKYLIEQWDGDLDQYRTISNQYQRDHPEYRYAWREWNGWDNEINSFLASSMITKQEFADVWQRYRQLEHNYITADLLNQHDCLVKTGKTYVWLSNAFDMQYTRFLYGKEFTTNKFTELLSRLNQSDGVYLIESCGQFYKVNW